MYEFENLALSTNLDKKIETELKNLAINCYSCLKEEGKKINYMAYIKMKSSGAGSAKVLFTNWGQPAVEQNIAFEEGEQEIAIQVDNIECISNIRKKFYKEILEKRYNTIKDVYENIK